MGYPIQQNQTVQPLTFFLAQSSDHISGLTGVNPTVTLSKNGGAFAFPAGAVTEVGNGWYQVAGNATDANTLGPLILHATATGADPTDDIFPVVAYNPQNSGSLGLTAMPINLAQAVAIGGNTANTIGDCLNGARAQAFGKWTLNTGTNQLTLYAPDGSTIVRQFQLDSSQAPTQRV